MTRAPWVLPKPSRAFPAGNVTAVSTTLGWRLVNERMPAEWTVSLGEANEQLADRFGDLAASGRTSSPPAPTTSPTRPGTAGFYDDLVVPVAGVGPGPRRGHPARLARAEKLAGLKPSFRPGRHHHRRQRLAAQRRRLRRAARLRGAPRRDRRRPARPDRRPRRAALDAAGLRLRAGRGGRPGAGPGRASPGPTSAAVELNEAFAVQSLACVDAWKDRPRDRQRQGRRDRDRPPARRLRRPDPRHPGRTGCASPATGGAWPRSASASARRLAVVLENVDVTSAS